MKVTDLVKVKQEKEQAKAARYYHCLAVITELRKCENELQRLDAYIDLDDITQVNMNVRRMLLEQILLLEKLSK